MTKPLSTLRTLSASIAALLLGAAGAAAESHYVWLNIYNGLTNGQAVTGWVINQNMSVDVGSPGGQGMQSYFETTRDEYSTGHYDVRITRKGDQSHQYCDFHATAMYQGRNGWYCNVSNEGTSNGASCSGRAEASPSTQACRFNFNVN